MTTTLLATMLATSAIVLPAAVDDPVEYAVITVDAPLWRDILSCKKHPTLPWCT